MVSDRDGALVVHVGEGDELCVVGRKGEEGLRVLLT